MGSRAPGVGARSLTVATPSASGRERVCVVPRPPAATRVQPRHARDGGGHLSWDPRGRFSEAEGRLSWREGQSTIGRRASVHEVWPSAPATHLEEEARLTHAKQEGRPPPLRTVWLVGAL